MKQLGIIFNLQSVYMFLSMYSTASSWALSCIHSGITQ
jgi:hypothetical protein